MIKSKLELFDYLSDVLVEVKASEATIYDSIKNDSRFKANKNKYYSELMSIFKADSIDLEKLDGIVVKVMALDIEEKILFFQAIDTINPFKIEFNFLIKDYMNYEKVLNSRNTNVVKIIPTYRNDINHKHATNKYISNLFSNFCYYYVGNNYNVINHYISDNYDSSKAFRVGFIPYDSTIKRSFSYVESGTKNYVEPQNSFENDEKVNLNWIYEEIKYLIKNDVNLIILPETLEKLDDKIIESLLKKSNTIVFGPCFYDFSGDKIRSISNIYSNEFLLGKENVIKKRPYITKYNGSEEAVYSEKIDSGDSFHILHIKNFGRVLLLICSDAFDADVKEVVNVMNIDCIAISSCTDSYLAFKNEFSTEVDQNNRILLQCNLCSQCFEGNHEPINQIFYMSKKIKSNEKATCEKPCLKKCDKHFMFDIDLENRDKCSIEEVELNE